MSSDNWSSSTTPSTSASGSGLSGKRFLANLADALPELPAAHSWNVDVADFVPMSSQPQQQPPQQQQQQQTSMPRPQWQQPQQQQQQQHPDAIGQLVNQSLSSLLAAGSNDRDGCDEELNACLLRLYQLAKSVDDLSRLVLLAIDAARRSAGGRLCEPAANLLAFLAFNFVVTNQVCPHLYGRSPSLASNPVYESLLTVCSTENDRVNQEIAAANSLTTEQANYILMFCWLYMHLPSLRAPTQRQGPMAKVTLTFLKQLADLPGCPLAYRTVREALAGVGPLLDYDSCDSECQDRGDLGRMLGELYDLLRRAAASGRVGDPAVSSDLIRLLELRAYCWLPRDNAGGAANAASASSGSNFAAPGGRFQSAGGDAAGAGGSQSTAAMTDDMYADYEKFLRDSGQL